MGGLLVKELLRTSVGMGHQAWRSTKGVMFLSTPHTGAELAGIASGPLGGLLWPTEPVKELEPNSPYLLELKAWFSESSVEHAIKTSVLYERRPYWPPVVGVIVDAASANPDVPQVVPIPVDHDHCSICKPLSKEDLVFFLAQEFLKECFPQRRWNPFSRPVKR
jgi:hypothetical protein